MNRPITILSIIFLFPFVVVGQFGPRQYMERSVIGFLDLQNTDLNNDGKPDIVASGGSGFGWFENLNDGDLQISSEKIKARVGVGSIYDLRIVDMDLDGDLDLVGISSTTDRGSILFNEGNGLFTQETFLTGIPERPSHLAVGDIDQNGTPDIVLHCDYEESLTIYRNSASSPGSFTGPESISNYITTVKHLEVFDYDGDGDMDIIRTNYTGLITVERNNGDGTFSTAGIESFGSASFSMLRIVDLDNDGDKDFIGCYDSAGMPIRWVENLGGGTYADSSTLFISPHPLDDIKIMDMNDDGSPDIIAMSPDNSNITFYPSNGDGTFDVASAKTILSSGFTETTFADFDGDGDLDLKYSLSGKLYGATNPGTNESFVSELIYNGVFANLWVTSGDIDGDGLQDVAVASRDSRKFVWYRNLGDMTFSEAILIEYYGGTTEPESIDLEDLDGDGDLDCLVATEDDGAYIYENLGGGNFATSIYLGQFVKGLTEDLDNDGDQDLILETFSNPRYMENLGDMNFGPATPLASPRRISEIADVDNDGDLDFVGGNLVGYGEVYWVENNGGFSFTEHVIDNSFDSPFSVYPYDLNGDGYLELVASSRDDDKVSYYLNNGDGTFGTELPLIPNVGFPRNTFFLDVDNDGDGDIITNSNDDGTIYMYSPNEDGTYSFNTTIDSSLTSWSCIPVDLDNDGDSDLVSVGYSGNILYYQNYAIEGSDKIISGRVFLDEDEDGVFDPGEPLLKNMPISISPDPYIAFTGSADGNNSFKFVVKNGAYTIAPELDDCFEISTPDLSYTIIISDFTSPSNPYDFGVKPISSYEQVEPMLTSAPTRCGFTVPFTFQFENKGCVKSSGKAGLLVSDLTNLVQVLPMPDETVGDTMFWNYTDLLPNDSRQVYLEFTIAGPEFIGSFIEMPLVAYHTDGGGGLSLSGFSTFLSEINCAYDPNDKLVRPARAEFETYTQNFITTDERLDYTIRFQNTGTDTAFNIVIKDVLDKDLDWTTLRPSTASHDYRLDFNDETGQLTFSFDDILLPDSIVNEPASHGFVNFSIYPKSDLAEFTEINNSAGIYFDFNPPIFTNTTKNVILGFIPAAVIPGFDFAAEDLEVTFTDLSQNNPFEWEWDFGDGNMSNEENPTHTYAEDGLYEVCLTVSNFYTVDTICQWVNIVTSHLNETEILSNIFVSPNPTTGTFHVSGIPNNIQDVQLEILDVTGKVISVPLTFDRHSVSGDVSSLTQGMYFIRFISNDGRAMIPLVKK